MERILTQFPYSPEGAILRLAWLEGLSREEIAALTWDQVQFEDNALTLPDRTVPLAPSAEDCPWERYRLYAQRDPHVIISDRYQRPMPPESVSRLARTALDTEGQKVSLKDLRQDFVIRQLQTHDWTYAARGSGMAVSTLRVPSPNTFRSAKAPRRSCRRTANISSGGSFSRRAAPWWAWPSGWAGSSRCSPEKF